MTAPMTTEQKGKLIASIMRTLETTAKIQKKAFDDGIFFALAFKTDAELNKIAKLVIV